MGERRGCRGLAAWCLIGMASLMLTEALVSPAPAAGVGGSTPTKVGRDLISSGHVLVQGLPSSISAESDRDSAGTFLNFKTRTASSEHLIPLGRLGCKRFLACSRQKLWWMNPEWGSTAAEIPNETQFLLFQLADTKGVRKEEEGEAYGVIFPLISGAFRASLEASKGLGGGGGAGVVGRGWGMHDSVSLRIESGDTGIVGADIRAIAFVATGSDPFALVRTSMEAVQRQLKTFELRSCKPVPPAMDWFGWCTWDAFYSKVDGPGIMRGVDTLRAGGVPPKLVIIDDGWQDTSNLPQRALFDLPPPSLASDSLDNAWSSENAQGGTRGGLVKDANLVQLGRSGSQALPRQLSTHRAEKNLVKPAQLPRQVAGSVLGTVCEAVMSRWQALCLCASQCVLRLLSGYHDNFVAHAAHTSWHIKVWRVLSGTVLKAAIVAEYASKYDFAKRLQSLHASDRFLGTLADASFPNLVSTLKGEYGVKFVYCWHALTGYWSGVHPGTQDAAENTGLEDLEVSVQTPIPTSGALQVEPRLSWDALTLKGVGVSSRGKMDEFYDRMHSYLRSCNVDGVKVDVQAAATMLGAGRGGSAVATREMVQAMERSVSKTFGRQQCINCMCHPIECLYSYQDTCVARASDDFYPNDAASHTLHVANVAYNSLFLGEIVFPDWDMFQSNNSVATLHAVARAVGGCSVYISDHPGEHDLQLLKRIVLPDGSVLRALHPGKPTRDCLFADVTMDGETACKVWNRNACGGGVVAAFNLQGAHWDRVRRRSQFNGGPDYKAPLVSASVAPRDFECRCRNVTWAVLSTHWAVDGNLVHAGFSISAYADRNVTTLKPKECAIYTFAPIRVARSKQAEVKWAALGLENMFNAGGAILAADAGSESIHLKVRGQGSLVVYVSRKPRGVLVDGVVRDHDFVYSAEQGLLRVELPTRAGSLPPTVPPSKGDLKTVPAVVQISL